MSNFSQRLNKLEPPPQHSEYLKEVGQRLFRIGIETRHQVQTGKLPAFAWGEEAEKIYQRWKMDPSFEAEERAILASMEETKIEKTADA
jgi:hypothetical protein